ncbi:MAG: response regulator [Anaerolineaceae bacterium]|nr:response regulator [Anaerolineaceae bacterium]
MDSNESKLIIYIEDDPEMVELVSMILSRHGYRVLGANDGLTGLELIIEENPDLILLDLMIPDMDGWDVYKQLVANETTRSVPVIVITAKSQPIDRVLGLHIAKVDDYIRKPFHPQELLESIERVFKVSKS